ncbi:hypothetical protein K1F50_15530 [Muricauda oceani]|uniref:Uncharacterized protein n=1 Tax=Flagellimonas oceani TaxID=2698672 RepID=A0A6G7IZV1_9FLAO|nr:hypothetical protein [Allomuricauda oceani]MBW8244219.1 hypothetical protein [Allomuricauda oceani]QII44131.1 hypothetical protein GVT53_05400 [Allomuricauda oceani]
MRQSSFKISISILFLAIFLTLKIAGLHSFAHLGDGDHPQQCDVCDMVVASQCLPIASFQSEEITFYNGDFLIVKTNPEVYCFVPVNKISVNLLFSRPPPYFI